MPIFRRRFQGASLSVASQRLSAPACSCLPLGSPEPPSWCRTSTGTPKRPEDHAAPGGTGRANWVSSCLFCPFKCFQNVTRRAKPPRPQVPAQLQPLLSPGNTPSTGPLRHRPAEGWDSPQENANHPNRSSAPARPHPSVFILCHCLLWFPVTQADS